MEMKEYYDWDDGCYEKLTQSMKGVKNMGLLMTSAKICGLCEDIKEMACDRGRDLQIIGKAEEIIHEIRLKNCEWEHLWDAPDGTYKGRCRRCGFVNVFVEGHDAQYNFCPNCGDQKRIRD